MFLLILIPATAELNIKDALNSIMFLLIREPPCYIYVDQTDFKFHYVSINSGVSPGKIRKESAFKFHYVSINSEISL